MNSIFKDKKVAFSGNIPFLEKAKLTNYLNICGAKLVICASNIDFMIVGSDYLAKYKCKTFKPAHILPFQKVVETIPVPQTELWVDRYKPRRLSEIIGQKTQIESLLGWLRNWPADGPRGALVTGPPGIGKTTAVHLLVVEAGYTVVELNASNERSAAAVRRWFEEASRSHCVGAKRVVVMDEVDGMSSGDRGGVGELGRVVRSCSFPIICIANERTPKLRPLASCCLDIRFVRPTRTVIAKALMDGVVKEQRLPVGASTLETLCERNGNDIRSILNYLQFSSRSSSSSSSSVIASTTKDELLRVDAFSAAGRLFGSSGTIDDRCNLVFVDFGLVPLMVAEGYIGAAAKSGGDQDKLARCIRSADCLGDWDIIDTRLRKTQSWNLLPSATMAVVSAAKAAEGPAPFQIFPSWLGKHSKRLKHARNLRDLSRRSGISSMLDCADTLRTVLFAPGTAEEVVSRLVDLRLTRDDMLETLVDTAFPLTEFNMDSKLKSAITREWKKAHKDDAVNTKEVSDEMGDIDETEDTESVDICLED